MLMILTGDFLSPKNIIIHRATTTGYMKLIVEDIPLDMFAYPINKVMDVIERSKLRRTILHTSPNELRRSVFPLLKAYTISTIAAAAHL